MSYQGLHQEEVEPYQFASNVAPSPIVVGGRGLWAHDQASRHGLTPRLVVVVWAVEAHFSPFSKMVSQKWVPIYP